MPDRENGSSPRQVHGLPAWINYLSGVMNSSPVLMVGVDYATEESETIISEYTPQTRTIEILNIDKKDKDV